MTRTAIALQQLREQERANRAQEGLKHASNVLNAVGTGLQFIPGVASGVGAIMRGAGSLIQKKSSTGMDGYVIRNDKKGGSYGKR